MPTTPGPYRYESPSGRTTAILWLFGLRILIDIVSLGSSALQLQLLTTALAGGEIDQQTADANDARQMLVSLLEIAIGLVSWIMLLVWIHRAAKNAWALESEKLEYTPGWCVGCFFIPFLNLVRPYQSMKMILQASRSSPLRLKARAVTPVLGLWWFLVLVVGVVNRVMAALIRDASTVEEFYNATILMLIGSLLDIVLCGTVIALVRNTLQLQERKSLATEAGRVCAGCGEPLGGMESICPLCGQQNEMPAPAFDR